jgi:(1->4)-alpha-D-glucan 1-alpha-D-glucosylmutase
MSTQAEILPAPAPEAPERLKECIDRHLDKDARVPVSTYRVQMHAGFTFKDAEATFDYLKQLGIGDYYASPIFEARPGSMHGYDVVRHDRINPEIGGNAGFEVFAKALQDRGMGLLLDIVPNHMGVGNDSRWWQDVLENGRASEFAEYFDIDWNPLKPDMQGKLLLPILGKQYGEELDSGNIQVEARDGELVIRYFDHTMPVAPRTLPILFPEAELDESQAPEDFRALLREVADIPPHDTADAAMAAQRRQRLADLRPRLVKLLASDGLKPVLEKALKRVAAPPGMIRNGTTGCMSYSKPNLTGSLTGECLRRKLITDDSST